MISAAHTSTHLEATARPANQQLDGITLSKGLTSQVILEILGMILAGRSLQEVLTSVVRVVEAQREDEGMLCAVWLLDQERVHMRAIAAPTLPESYIAALDGFSVGPQGGTCGAAVNRREPVFVSDVLTDPILEQVRDVNLAHGIRACWSAPIISHQAEILGTFAFYFRFVRVPNPGDMQLIDGARRIAAIAIERKRAEDKVRHSEECLAAAQHLSHTGSFGCKVSNGEMFWSEETFRIFEYDRRTKPCVEAVLARVHPDERLMVQTHMDLAKRNRTACDIEYRLLLPSGAVKRVHVVADPRGEKPEDFDFVGAVMDITEQWQARTRLEQAVDEIKLLKDQLFEENLALRDEVDRASMFGEIVGTSQALQRALSLAVKVAPTTSGVLITGETGTGKELIARAIHKCSARAGRPFVSVNCAALPSSLISSELFGHEKGAFTGATQRRLGRFELAHGGTLFLDEVGDLPMDVQIALLRVLQEKEFERVGGTETIRSDVRVIAATNCDLEAAVASGAFRSDLLYRLNVFPIDVPPLRERKDDVLLLLQYFVRRFATEAGKTFDRIDKRTIELFQAYDWPGNIRELQNVVERSVIVSSPGVFRVDDAWLSLSGNRLPRRHAKEEPADDAGRERKIIEAALAETYGRVSGPQGAAAKLRVPPTTLDYKIKRLGIRKSRFKLDSFSKPPHS